MKNKQKGTKKVKKIKKKSSKLNGRKKTHLVINQPQLVDKFSLSKLKFKYIKSIIDWILIIYEMFQQLFDWFDLNKI